MPYKNILWIKLEIRLLNDSRFFTLTPDAQRVYLKMLLLAGQNKNKTCKNLQILGSCLRECLMPSALESCILEIKTNFPKFRESNNFYYFQGFSTKHNWVSPRNSQGTPKDSQDKNRIDKIREEKIREEGEQKKVKSVFKGEDIVFPIQYLNTLTNSTFSIKSRATLEMVRARYKEGYTKEDFKTVIDKKAAEWVKDERMCKYLRPKTLFNATNFENYLNQKGKVETYDDLKRKFNL